MTRERVIAELKALVVSYGLSVHASTVRECNGGGFCEQSAAYQAGKLAAISAALVNAMDGAAAAERERCAEIQELAAQHGMAAQELDPGVWMFEAADDMGEWAVEQDDAMLNQRLAAGRVQATGGGV